MPLIPENDMSMYRISTKISDYNTVKEELLRFRYLQVHKCCSSNFIKSTIMLLSKSRVSSAKTT